MILIYETDGELDLKDNFTNIVSVSEIANKLQKGETVQYNNVVIEGDLDLSSLDLPTMHVQRTDIQKSKRLPEETKLITSTIIISNATINGVLKLNNAIFQEPIIFQDSEFNKYINFANSQFNNIVNFQQSTFNDTIDFSGSKFNGFVCFVNSHFNGDANFERSLFNSNATDFSGAQSNSFAYFDKSQFNNTTYFVGSQFKDISFQDSRFNSFGNFRYAKLETACFENSIFIGDAIFERSKFGRFASFKNSSFNKTARFQESAFNGISSFKNSKFDDVAILLGAQFSGISNFEESQFNSDVSFRNSYFNDTAIFSNVHFYNDAYFENSNFTYIADFRESKFDGDSCFQNSGFKDIVDFYGSQFNGDAYFRDSGFSSTVDFKGAQFNGDADFKEVRFDKINLTNIQFSQFLIEWNAINGKLVCDGPTYLNLIKNFKNLERFDDAHRCYYEYRKWSQFQKSYFSWAFFSDGLSWIFCGYGITPIYTLAWSAFFITAFAILFRRFKAVRRLKCHLCPDSAKDPEIANLKECFYYSVLVFFHTHPPASWHASSEFWKWVVIAEDIIGWLLLAIFVVVLVNVIITW